MIGNVTNDIDNETIEHHFHLFEMKGFFSFTLRKINLVST